MDYTESSWAVVTNIILILVFGLKLYDLYARSWLAHTGKYFTKGKVKFCECAPQNARAVQYMESDPEDTYITLITYTYAVDDNEFVSTYLTNELSRSEAKSIYHKDAEVMVYYSPKLPQYSFINKVPGKLRLLKRFAFRWFVVPVAFLNLASCIAWYLIFVFN